MAEESLKSKTKTGLYWSAASNFATQGMRFAFGIILARLLSPDAYGVIGMLSIFMCIVSTFIDCGFSQALITKQDRTQKDFSTEFWFNIVVGVVGYLILFVASPFIADFYDMPILSPILKVIGLGVIINSLCVVQSAQFAIRLDFKTPAKIGVYTQLFTGIAGIVLAYYGLGVWALVFQQIAGGILNAICLWAIARWKPTLEFSLDSLNYLWGYGSKILGTSLITQIYDNVYPLIIGKYHSSNALGLYTRAQGFAALPSSNLAGILGNVTFPILSSINNDEKKLASAYRKLVRMSAFVVFPLMMGMFAVSSPLVKVLLNEKWYACIPILQVLCFAMIWQPISLVNLNLLKAARRPDVVLKLDVIKRGFGLIILVVTCQFDVLIIAGGYAFLALFSVILNTIFTSRVLNVPFMDQIKDLFSIFLNSCIMSSIVFALSIIIVNKILSLTIGIIMGVSYYLVTSRFFFKKEFEEIVFLLKRKAQ